MRVEIEIVEGTVPENGLVLERFAAKAVLQHDGRLLMLRSRHGDYKFPGGGVHSGETVVEALKRELREECGLRRIRVGEPMVRVLERRPAREAEAVFSMVSDYFRTACDDPESVGSGQQLDMYERDLELTPTWVEPWAAVRANLTLADSASGDVPWLQRETLVLIEILRLTSDSEKQLGEPR